MRNALVPALVVAVGLLVALVPGCPVPETFNGDGPIAEGIAAPLGEPVPSATAAQLDVFERGKAVLTKRFKASTGLGPAFNVEFCGACHEKPVGGGDAGLYRNFFLAGRETADGAFVFSESDGAAGGVLRVFNLGTGNRARPIVPSENTLFSQRNSIPIFGTGLLAEIPEAEILSRSDPNDADGDGISGRPNYDRGFVGRFGRKCQTVSIEGFIRGPLFNHLGVTTTPLSDEQRSQLPIDSSAQAVQKAVMKVAVRPEDKLGPHEQAAAPDGPTTDADAAPDPEMSQQELFELVSFSMLLAAPQFDEPTDQTLHGNELFHEVNCVACHTPRLNGPRGPIPAYTDLLIHDMGPDLADGIVMKDATGSEFRTQPLWGIIASAAYLHDGRAKTLEEAILAHGGEAQASRDSFANLSRSDRDHLIAFLGSLGGRSQASAGLLPPDAPVPAVGAYGGPFRALSDAETTRFITGRALFDREFAFSEGTGGMTGSDNQPRFNGDSCRACHFDPVIGGAGPISLNVMRHGVVDGDGNFAPPPTTPNTILHKQTDFAAKMVEPTADCNVFEMRQTPHSFGAGLIDAIAGETILANADEADSNADGISGKAHVLPDGRVGRFGWKAQVPSIGEFIRDAMAAEIGLTVESQAGLTFGMDSDTDGAADPELSAGEAEDMAFFLGMLAPPPRQTPADPTLAALGEQLFETTGCTACHIPSLASSLGDAPLFSDLLLHDILPAGTPGIVDGVATQTEFRTAPLWGLSHTAPYFHDGLAETIEDAILRHDGEARPIRDEFEGLSESDQAALLAFLETL